MKKLLALILVVAVGAGAWFALRHRNHTPASAATTTTTTTTPTMRLQAYFYRGAELAPVAVDVPRTEAVATAATRALLAGPPPGYRTAVPSGATLEGLVIAGRTADARFSPRLVHPTRSAQAQIVYTLTQFPTITRVNLEAAGRRVALSDGADNAIAGPATRTDYADLLPSAPISVTAPIRDSTITSPVRISGTASVFEATIALDVWRGAKRVVSRSITASVGAPERGTFDETLSLSPGSYKLVLYEPSAANGLHLHSTTVAITVAG